MKKVTNIHDLGIAVENNEDFILSKNIYEMLLESNWDTVFSDTLKEYVKTHKVVKGED